MRYSRDQSGSELRLEGNFVVNLDEFYLLWRSMCKEWDKVMGKDLWMLALAVRNDKGPRLLAQFAVLENTYQTK